jgi:hypothetical protein
MHRKNESPPGKGGRPAKFDEPSRPVTMTLPDRILDRLAELDGDRARAVVKAVEAALDGGARPLPAVDELAVSGDEALLVVARSPLLASIPWLTMIEIAPGRHLISLREGVPIEKLEVALEDLLDGAEAKGAAETNILRTLLESIRKPRRNRAVRTEQILVVRATPAPSARPSRAAARRAGSVK